MYDVALRNLGDEKEEVDKLVEEYRRSLVRLPLSGAIGGGEAEKLISGKVIN